MIEPASEAKTTKEKTIDKMPEIRPQIEGILDGVFSFVFDATFCTGVGLTGDETGAAGESAGISELSFNEYPHWGHVFISSGISAPHLLQFLPMTLSFHSAISFL